MKRYYGILQDDRNSVVQIKPNKHYDEVENFIRTSSSERLPDDVVFDVIKGKKWMDIIYYFEAASNYFFSRRFIDILSAQGIDMVPYCYPIKINGYDNIDYYVINNLDRYENINPDNIFDDIEEPLYFHIPDNDSYIPDIFSVQGTNMKIISEETMLVLQKNRVTNVWFIETYALSSAECAEWKKLHAQNKAMLPNIE